MRDWGKEKDWLGHLIVCKSLVPFTVELFSRTPFVVLRLTVKGHVVSGDRSMKKQSSTLNKPLICKSCVYSMHQLDWNCWWQFATFWQTIPGAYKRWTREHPFKPPFSARCSAAPWAAPIGPVTWILTKKTASSAAQHLDTQRRWWHPKGSQRHKVWSTSLPAKQWLLLGKLYDSHVFFMSRSCGICGSFCCSNFASNLTCWALPRLVAVLLAVVLQPPAVHPTNPYNLGRWNRPDMIQMMQNQGHNTPWQRNERFLLDAYWILLLDHYYSVHSIFFQFWIMRQTATAFFYMLTGISPIPCSCLPTSLFLPPGNWNVGNVGKA